MRYLIDGYNLMFALGLLTKQSTPGDVPVARRRLLEFLHARLGDGATGVTVIFDAKGAPRRTPAETTIRGISVRFALNEEADDVIEDFIRRETIPKELSVVSDDRRIRDAAFRQKCGALRCLDFVEQIAFPAALAETNPDDAAAKPAAPSAEETEAWLREFGDVERDPVLRKWLRQDDFGIP